MTDGLGYVILFGTKGDDRIHARGSSCWHIASCDRDDHYADRRRHICEHVGRFDAEQQGAEASTGGICRRNSDCHASDRDRDGFAKDEDDHLAAIGAERHTNADL